MSKITEVRSNLLASAATPRDAKVALTPTPTAGGIPANVLQGMDKAAAAFQASKTPAYAFPAPFAPSRIPQVNLLFRQLGHVLQVSRLDQAEKLAQDAFQKVSNPNANFVDKLQAQEEMQQVDKLRQAVEKTLTPLQQQALEHINDEEQKAVKTEITPSDGQSGAAAKALPLSEMNEAAQESKSLDKWIMS